MGVLRTGLGSTATARGIEVGLCEARAGGTPALARHHAGPIDLWYERYRYSERANEKPATVAHIVQTIGSAKAVCHGPIEGARRRRSCRERRTAAAPFTRYDSRYMILE